eukprot:jgi/Ulvmu1/4941/UM205_0003.1
MFYVCMQCGRMRSRCAAAPYAVGAHMVIEMHVARSCLTQLGKAQTKSHEVRFLACACFQNDPAALSLTAARLYRITRCAGWVSTSGLGNWTMACRVAGARVETSSTREAIVSEHLQRCPVRTPAAGNAR